MCMQGNYVMDANEYARIQRSAGRAIGFSQHLPTYSQRFDKRLVCPYAGEHAERHWSKVTHGLRYKIVFVIKEEQEHKIPFQT